jgi:hypothetical protein
MDEFRAEDSSGSDGNAGGRSGGAPAGAPPRNKGLPKGPAPVDGAQGPRSRSRESYWYRPPGEPAPPRSVGGRWIDPIRLAKAMIEIGSPGGKRRTAARTRRPD